MARKWLLAVVVAVLVVLVVFWVLFGFALAGRQAYAAQDYEQALALLERTPFFRQDKLSARKALDREAGLQLLRAYKKGEDVQPVLEQAAALMGYTDALRALSDGDYVRAAEGMLAESAISPAQWLLIYDAAWGEDRSLEDFLARIKGRALLDEAISGEDGIDTEAIMKAAGMVQTLSRPDAQFVLDSTAALTGGQGVLFVVEKRLFGAADTRSEVCTELMQALPADWIPEGPQAQYLVVLSYDYEQIGKMDNGVGVKLREFGRVTVYDENGIVYASDVMRGNEPASVCITGTSAPYVSGGAPQLALLVRRAVLAVY